LAPKIISVERLLVFGLVLSMSMALIYRGQFMDVYPFYIPVGALFAVNVLRVLYTMRIPRPTAPVTHLVLLFLALIALALPFSRDTMQSVSLTLYLYVCLLLFLYMYHNVHVIGTLPIFWAVVVLLVAQVGLGLLQVLTGKPIGVISMYLGESLEFTRGSIIGSRRALGTFTNPNVYTQVVALLTACTLALYVVRRRVWYLFLSTSGLVVLVLSFSRGAWVAVALLVATTALVYIRQPTHRRYTARFLTAILASVAVLWLGLAGVGIHPLDVMSRHIELRGGVFYVGDQKRISGIAASFHLASERFFGVGLGAFEETAPAVGLVRVHSAPFLMLSEVGWLVFLIFCSFGTILIMDVGKSLRWAMIEPLVLGGFIFLPAFMFFSLVYLSFMQREVFALYCMFYGAVMGMLKRERYAMRAGTTLANGWRQLRVGD